MKQSFLQIYFTLKVSAEHHKWKEFSTRRKSFPPTFPSTKKKPTLFQTCLKLQEWLVGIKTSAYYTPVSVCRLCSQDKSGSQDIHYSATKNKIRRKKSFFLCDRICTVPFKKLNISEFPILHVEWNKKCGKKSPNWKMNLSYHLKLPQF